MRNSSMPPATLQLQVFSKQTTWHQARRQHRQPREIQQPSISALTAPSSVYSNARAVIFDWMRVQEVNQFDAHKSRTRARRKLQFIVATSGNRATGPAAPSAHSLWVSQSSLLCLYSPHILIFLLKMLANKGHILCMPLVKSNGQLSMPNCPSNPAKVQLTMLLLLLLLLLGIVSCLNA